MNLSQVFTSSLIKCAFLLFFLSAAFTFQAFPQNIRLTYLNTTNYPEIEAGFVATNSDGMKIFNSTKEDFALSENSQTCNVIEVINPKQNYQPVSVVIVIDVSISMEGRKLALTKEGVADIIEQLPLETSEVAITCFSDESYVYSDFTQSKNRLISALNRIKNINGTDFNNAFMNPDMGALALSKAASNKKVVIFVTDGLGTTDTERVSKLANTLSAEVYAINVILPIPKDLVEVTRETNGKYFERIANKSEFRAASSAILKQLECTDHGIVKWLSRQGCDIVKPVQMRYKGVLVELDYDVPDNKIGKLEVNPSQMQFGGAKIGLEQAQGLQLTAQNIPLTINSMAMDTKSPFKLADSIRFPLTLNPGESLNSKVKFTAVESGLFETNLKIDVANCPETNIKLLAGGEEQIKLIFPIGGEVFTIGEDTSVLWEGVKKAQPVEISYRDSEKTTWKKIDNARQLRYLWHLPGDTGSNFQVKLTPLKMADENVEITATIEGTSSPFIYTMFSPDGYRIVTTDKDGFVKTWDTRTGKIITSLGGYKAEKAFSPNNEVLYMFFTDEILVWNLRTDKLTGRISMPGKKVLTSMILPDGSQYLVPANVTIDQARNVRIWSGMFPAKAFLFNQPELRWASFTPDCKLAITLTEKNEIGFVEIDSTKLLGTMTFKELISTIVISPDGSKAILKLPQDISVIDIKNRKELYRVPNAQFKKFTGEGKFFITNNTNLYDSQTGTLVTTLNQFRYFEVSPKSGYLLLNKQDTLELVQLNNRKTVLRLANKPFRLACFNSDETKAYILTLNNTIEIYETASGAFLGTIDKLSRKIKKLDINPLNFQISLLTDDNRIEILSPTTHLVMKDAISGKFTIASPKPSVIDTVNFNDQFVNELNEINIGKFAWNSTKYPLKIKQISLSGADAEEFEVAASTFPLRLDAKSQLAQEFRFRPSAIGVKKAIIKTYTATDSFSTVIIGRGIEQNIVPATRYIDFGKVKVNSSKDTLVPLLINNGNSPVVIRKIKNEGPDEAQFKIVSNGDFQLGPKDTLKALMRFNPLSRGKTTTIITFEPDNQSKVILRGEGIAPREIILTGITRNAADSLPIEARVKKTDLGSNTVMEEQATKPNGKYTLKLVADRNFSITAEKENFISTSVNIDLTEKVPEDTVYQDIFLTEIKPGAIIQFNCIFFEFNKSTLLPGSQADLNRLLELITAYPNHTFEIHGHTDDVGSDAYNLNLAKARATTVLNYLIKNGASKEKLSIKYFGESKPVAPNTTDEGRALNRRVELKVVN